MTESDLSEPKVKVADMLFTVPVHVPTRALSSDFESLDEPQAAKKKRAENNTGYKILFIVYSSTKDDGLGRWCEDLCVNQIDATLMHCLSR